MLRPLRRKITIVRNKRNKTYLINGEEIECKTVTKTVHGDNNFDADKVIDTYYDRWQMDEDSKYYNMTKDEIKQKWEEIRQTGINIHDDIERYYTSNYKRTNMNNSLFVLFLRNFEPMRISKGWLPIEIESYVYKDKMIGKVDAIFKKDDKYILVDWKFRNTIKETDREQVLLYKDMCENTFRIKEIDEIYIVLIHETIDITLHKIK